MVSKNKGNEEIKGNPFQSLSEESKIGEDEMLQSDLHGINGKSVIIKNKGAAFKVKNKKVVPSK